MDMDLDLPVFFNIDEFGEQVYSEKLSKTVIAIIDVGQEYNELQNHAVAKIATVIYKNIDLIGIDVGDLLFFHGLSWTITSITEMDRVVSRAEVRAKEAVRV